ncbi:MAG TPA: tetratricopeptide repeat protein [Verrucomicrobiae bacterium]|nr:tetratricopeptide repeat protein [Verrucomicrobiae bacterium]
MRRYGLLRTSCALAVGAVLLAFGTIQAASYSLDAAVAVPGAIPHAIPPSFGLAVYHVLDRIAPAPYVEATLAAQALGAGDAALARYYAIRMPAAPDRDELLARAAALDGEQTLALEYFLAAPDVDAVERAAYALAGAKRPQAGYAVEAELAARLRLTVTHPDALAEAYWNLGQLADRTAWIQVPGSPVQKAWLVRALGHFRAAAALAPFSEKYAISAANQADFIGRRALAARLFAHAADLDPGSADAIAGLGVVAFERGDVAAARGYLMRARAIDPHSLMVAALERDLR